MSLKAEIAKAIKAELAQAEAWEMIQASDVDAEFPEFKTMYRAMQHEHNRATDPTRTKKAAAPKKAAPARATVRAARKK
jgi:hypothetical protein